MSEYLTSVCYPGGTMIKPSRISRLPLLSFVLLTVSNVGADTTPLTILDPNLQVTTYIGTGLSQPIGIVFIGPNDAFVLEKASGLVRRAINGVLQPTPVLDL